MPEPTPWRVLRDYVHEAQAERPRLGVLGYMSKQLLTLAEPGTRHLVVCHEQIDSLGRVPIVDINRIEEAGFVRLILGTTRLPERFPREASWAGAGAVNQPVETW